MKQVTAPALGACSGVRKNITHRNKVKNEIKDSHNSTKIGAIVAIFDFCFSVCFLCVMFFLTPERAPKAGPCHLYMICFNTTLIHLTRLLLQNCCTTFTLSIKYEIIEGFQSARCLNGCINLPNMIGLFASSGTASLVANI